MHNIIIFITYIIVLKKFVEIALMTLKANYSMVIT